MENQSRNTWEPNGFVARLGELFMMLVAGKDLRVRQAIVRTASYARSSRDLQLNTRWHARHNRAPDPRVE